MVRATFDAPAGAERGTPAVQRLRDGKCSFEGLKAGPWKLEAFGVGGTSRESRSMNVVAGETARVTFP
jgi:hypothetical protein